jgi:hypothetical protein
MSLPYDVTRCQGIDTESLPCDVRHKCERYLALLDGPNGDAWTARMLCAHTDSGGDGSYPFFIPAKR